MTARALSAADVGRELGRGADWVYSHWRQLVAEKKIPAPIIEAGGLTWNAAQFYAFIDKGLTREQRAGAAAYRAALEAALSAPSNLSEIDDIAQSRARLDQRFAASGSRLRAAPSPDAPGRLARG